MYQQLIRKQKQIIDDLKAYKDGGVKNPSMFKTIYDSIVAFNSNEGCKLIPELDKEAETDGKWDFTKVVRTLFQILSFGALINMIFFSGGVSQ